MKSGLYLLLAFLSFSAAAQTIAEGDLFPQLKKTKQQAFTFQGCVSGDCLEGTGIYMTAKTTSSTSRSNGVDDRTVKIYVFLGEFSDQGKGFKGKEYGLSTKYFFENSNKKKMEPDFKVKLDGSDPLLEKFLNYEGDFILKNETYLRNGKNGIMHYFIRTDENIKHHTSNYYNGYKNRESITYVDGFKHRSFEGWIQPAEQKTIGKLVFANGDTYCGTFFDDKFEGIGRLVTSSGTQEGFWKEGECIEEAAITISDEALIGILDDPSRIWIDLAQYEATKTGNYFGPHTDKVPDGQGLFFNYWGQVSAGNFSNGKLDGVGYRLTMEDLQHPTKFRYYPCTRETGVFTNGELSDGVRVVYDINSKSYEPFYLQLRSRKQINPVIGVASKQATVTEVVLNSTDVNEQYQQATQLMNENEYSKALYILLKIIDQQGYNQIYPMQAAFCYLMLQDLDKADQYAQQAININQTEFTGYLIKSFVEVARNEQKVAETTMLDAFFFDTGDNKQSYTKSLKAMTEANLNAGGCDQMLVFVQSNYGSRDKSYAAIQADMNMGSRDARKSYGEAAANSFNSAIQKSGAIKDKPWLKAYNAYLAGGVFYFANLFDDAKPFIDAAYIDGVQHKNSISLYAQLFINTVLAEYASNTLDLDQVQGYLNNAAPLLSQVGGYANDFKAKYYQSECRVFESTDQFQELIVSANKLKDLKNTGYDDYYKALALNFLGMGCGKSGTAAGRKTSFTYYEQALTLARQNGFTPIVEDVEANLPIAYWQAGDKPKAIAFYKNIIEKSTAEKDFKNAETSANNLAYLLFLAEDYTSAVGTFSKPPS